MTSEASRREPIEAVLFDVDDTLIDHEGAAQRGLEEHLRGSSEAYGPEVWAHWVTVEHVHFDRYLAGDLSFVEQRRARARGFTGATMSDPEADAWFDGYRVAFEAAWTVFDDVRPTLDTLSAAGLALGAFSNVDGAYTRRKLETVGLLDRFLVVLGRDDVTAGKPAPEPFHRMSDALGASRARALHVGDRYEIDARAARAAGLIGVWLRRPGADPQFRSPVEPTDPAVPVIASLLELPGLVDRGVPTYG